MKNKKPYLPITLIVGVVAVLLVASFPPRWIAGAQEAAPPGQQPTTGPQPDVGETVLSRIPGSVVLFEGVADGQAVTSDAWRTEVQVVVDQVKSAFGTNEEAAVTGIQLEAGAEIHQEVFVALVIGVVSVPATLTVDAGVLGADAADEFQIGVASELRRVNGIDIEKDGAKWQSRVAAVFTLASLPIDVPTDTEIVEEEDVAAKSGIGSAGQGDRGMVAVS